MIQTPHQDSIDQKPEEWNHQPPMTAAGHDYFVFEAR
jgi:hypothetical protein